MVSCYSDARAFESSQAKGGSAIDPKKTAMVAIEYQNEFCTDGGKLHPAVKEVMASTGMLANTAKVADVVRKTGAKVFHTPVTLKPEFCDAFKMIVIVIVKGKNGSDAFLGSDLEKQLKGHGIETVVLCGLLTNCCVVSTVRTACQKGFNVVTLTDYTTTTSSEGQKVAADPTTETYTMFSQPMTAAELVSALGKRGDECVCA
jgi:nicotinamidase-related amidase